MRILIIGSPGAGKSFFTNKLANCIQLPVFHLDDYYWLENWQRPTNEEWEFTLDELLKKQNWIIDGNYYDSFSKRLERANYVIYLDTPVFLCLLRALKRSWQRIFNADSLPMKIRADNQYQPKIDFDLKFLKLILFFKLKYKNKIINLLHDNNKSFIILKNRKDHDFFIQNCKKEHFAQLMYIPTT